MACKNIRGNAPYLQPLIPKSDREYDYQSFWESPDHLARYIEEKGKGAAHDDTGWNTYDPEWSGSNSMEETIRMARQGWPEGAERVARIRDYVAAANPVNKRNVRYGIAGTTPCVPRAVAGNIMNMRLPQDARSRKKPIITLVSNMGAYYHVQAKMISNRSAAEAAIIDQIEAAGFCVEVIAISPAQSWGDYRMCTTVLVKPSHQPTDIGRLAFGLGQASMFRRMAFADRGLEDSCRRLEGMGSTINLKHSEQTKDAGVFLLPSNNEGSEYFEDEKVTSTKGVQFLINKLKEQGCPAFPGDPVPLEDNQEPKKKQKLRIPLFK